MVLSLRARWPTLKGTGSWFWWAPRSSSLGECCQAEGTLCSELGSEGRRCSDAQSANRGHGTCHHGASHLPDLAPSDGCLGPGGRRLGLYRRSVCVRPLDFRKMAALGGHVAVDRRILLAIVGRAASPGCWFRSKVPRTLGSRLCTVRQRFELLLLPDIHNSRPAPYLLFPWRESTPRFGSPAHPRTLPAGLVIAAFQFLVLLGHKRTFWCRIVLWDHASPRQAHKRNASRHI